MSIVSFKSVSTVLATAVIAGMTLVSAADAKGGGGGKGGGGMGGSFKSSGMGGGGFGGFKGGMGSGFKSGPLKPFGGKFKPMVVCKGGGCGPKPGKHHHHGRRWFWGGATILAADYSGCGYEYYKWKSTGSSYWYNRYAECRAD